MYRLFSIVVPKITDQQKLQKLQKLGNYMKVFVEHHLLAYSQIVTICIQNTAIKQLYIKIYQNNRCLFKQMNM